VRLYSVDATGRHGVVFCSLDASRLAVVLAARMTLGLPYRYSRMRGYLRARDGARELAWTARTRWPGPAGIGSRVVVRVGDPLPTAAPGAEPDAEGENYDAKGGLAGFLTARWGLHTRCWAGLGTCPTSMSHGRCGPWSCCCWMTACWPPPGSATWPAVHPITPASPRVYAPGSARRWSWPIAVERRWSVVSSRPPAGAAGNSRRTDPVGL